jgi:hypothetical protein
MPDDIGQYRLAGLQPGSDDVRATPSPTDAAFNLARSGYPGTLAGASAEAAGVGLGSEIAGVDFSRHG